MKMRWTILFALILILLISCSPQEKEITDDELFGEEPNAITGNAVKSGTMSATKCQRTGPALVRNCIEDEVTKVITFEGYSSKKKTWIAGTRKDSECKDTTAIYDYYCEDRETLKRCIIACVDGQICQQGETRAYCESPSILPPQPFCGDGQCDVGEECGVCADCGVCPTTGPICGDFVCEGTETAITCPGDCEPPIPQCGDAICTGDETCATCELDCQACPAPTPEPAPEVGELSAPFEPVPTTPPEKVAKTVVLMMKFPDRNEPTLFQKDYAHDKVFGAQESLNSFITENSYSKMALEGSVHGWYTLPGNYGDYCVPHPNAPSMFQCRFYFGQGIDSNRIIAEDAVQVARANGVDFTGVSHLIIVTNVNQLACGAFGTYGRGVILRNPEGDVTTALIGISRDELADLKVGATGLYTLVHEFGHNLGLLHAADWICGENIVAENVDDPWAGCSVDGYGDKLDVMGKENNHHFSTANKEYAGFLDSSQILTVTSEGEYTLDQLEMPSAGYKAVKIPLGEGTFYSFEYRVPQGYDVGVPEGVYLRLQVPKLEEPKFRVTTFLPKVNGEFYYLTPGETFTDPFRPISVSVLSMDGTQAKLRVKPAPIVGSIDAPKEYLGVSFPMFMSGTTMTLTKGEKNKVLLPINVFVQQTRVPGAYGKLTLSKAKFHMNGALDDKPVFDAVRLYDVNGNKIGVDVIPTYQPELKRWLFEFNFDPVLEAGPLGYNFTLKADISTSDFDLGAYAFVIDEDIIGYLEGQGWVRNAYHTFTPKFVLG